jgi:hypothetical protein
MCHHCFQFLEEFEKKHKNFNNDLKRKDNIIQDQLHSLDEKSKTMKTLQERIRTLEKRLEVDSKFKDEIIKQLKQQVDQQGGQIAQLTFQLHSFNQNKLKSCSQQSIVTTITSPRNEPPRIRTKASSSLSSPTSSIEKNSFNLSMIDTTLPNKSSSMKRQSSAGSSISENNDRSYKPLKALHEIRNRIGVIPDLKPFLLNNDNDVGDMIPKRPSGVLPPIKVPPKFNRIVVESPHKQTSNTVLHNSPDVQSNNQ